MFSESLRLNYALRFRLIMRFVNIDSRYGYYLNAVLAAPPQIVVELSCVVLISLLNLHLLV